MARLREPRAGRFGAPDTLAPREVDDGEHAARLAHHGASSDGVEGLHPGGIVVSLLNEDLNHCVRAAARLVHRCRGGVAVLRRGVDEAQRGSRRLHHDDLIALDEDGCLGRHRRRRAAVCADGSLLANLRPRRVGVLREKIAQLLVVDLKERDLDLGVRAKVGEELVDEPGHHAALARGGARAEDRIRLPRPRLTVAQHRAVDPVRYLLDQLRTADPLKDIPLRRLGLDNVAELEATLVGVRLLNPHCRRPRRPASLLLLAPAVHARDREVPKLVLRRSKRSLRRAL